MNYDMFRKLTGLLTYCHNAHFLFGYKLNYYQVFCPKERELCSKALQVLAVNFLLCTHSIQKPFNPSLDQNIQNNSTEINLGVILSCFSRKPETCEEHKNFQGAEKTSKRGESRKQVKVGRMVLAGLIILQLGSFEMFQTSLGVALQGHFDYNNLSYRVPSNSKAIVPNSFDQCHLLL